MTRPQASLRKLSHLASWIIITVEFLNFSTDVFWKHVQLSAIFFIIDSHYYDLVNQTFLQDVFVWRWQGCWYTNKFSLLATVCNWWISYAEYCYCLKVSMMLRLWTSTKHPPLSGCDGCCRGRGCWPWPSPRRGWRSGPWCTGTRAPTAAAWTTRPTRHRTTSSSSLSSVNTRASNEPSRIFHNHREGHSPGWKRFHIKTLLRNCEIFAKVRLKL